jgi:hypothetical protein
MVNNFQQLCHFGACTFGYGVYCTQFMSNEPKNKSSLDERFATRPHMRERLLQMADLMDQAIADGATADEAEEMALREIRKLAQGMMTDWAQAQHQKSAAQTQAKHPSATRHIKKK